MYGDSKAVQIQFNGEGVIYNLTSMIEGFTPLRLLPPNSIGKFTDRDFDIAYMNYVMSNDQVFCEFFQIIYNLYVGVDVFIIASADDWSENILESLLKLIQQRYGYNATKITCEEDYIYACNSDYIPDFAPGFGTYNLDQDKERFSYIMMSVQLRTGNYPYQLKGFEIQKKDQYE
jgi:hypothetical protein